MANKILGFDSAKEEAKRIGRDNMMISAPLVFELIRRIESLEDFLNWALEEGATDDDIRLALDGI
jgi:hypothetical protein